MSDQSTPDLEFENPEDGELEVVPLEEGAEPPKPEDDKKKEGADDQSIRLTPEEYQALLARGEQTGALTTGLKELVGTLGRPVNTPAPEAQGPAEPSDEEFESELFTPGKGKSTVEKIAERTVAKIVGTTAAAMVAQNRRLLMLDPDTKENFATYKDEIDQRYNALPANLKVVPDIYDRIYKQVVFEKSGEITAKKAEVIAKEAVKKALEEVGFEVGADGKPVQKKAATPAPRLAQETGGRPSVSGEKKKLFITRDDVEDMRSRMMDPSDPEQVQAYLKNIKKTGGK